jgi:hypothetical protein
MNEEDKQAFVRRLINSAKAYGLNDEIRDFVKETAKDYGFVVTDEDLDYEHMCGQKWLEEGEP